MKRLHPLSIALALALMVAPPLHAAPPKSPPDICTSTRERATQANRSVREARLRLLKEQIEQAFKDAPYPGDRAMVEDPDDLECVDLMNAFKGKHWKELDAETLRRNKDTFLSIAGLQYYFPAYLMAALDDLEDILPFTVYGLCFASPEASSADVDVRKWQLKRFNSFSPAQKRAIKAFLEYVRDEYPESWSLRDPEPVRALRDHWGQVERE